MHPIFVPTYAMLLLCVSLATTHTAEIPSIWYLTAVIGTLFLTCIIPASALMLLWNGDIQKAYMRNKEDRRVPYIYGLIAAILWYLFLRIVLGVPVIVYSSVEGATLCLLLISLLNLKWKISAHTAMMGILFGGVLDFCLYAGLYSYGLWIALLMLSGGVMWARLYLNEHTEIETTIGYLIGLFTTFSIGIGGIIFSYLIWAAGCK